MLFSFEAHDSPVYGGYKRVEGDIRGYCSSQTGIRGYKRVLLFKAHDSPVSAVRLVTVSQLVALEAEDLPHISPVSPRISPYLVALEAESLPHISPYLPVSRRPRSGTRSLALPTRARERRRTPLCSPVFGCIHVNAQPRAPKSHSDDSDMQHGVLRLSLSEWGQLT